ncbi:MAG: UDP-N-acetylmuramate dehydrogenase [Methanoregulaceae archaeon]|nr:UDP-N-acetylmuramate dehydrogenase [Methanoregulaceae archaeon]
MQPPQLIPDVSLRPFTTLRAGGRADWFAQMRSVDELAAMVAACHQGTDPLIVLGWGSNVLPSDAGVAGTVIINETRGLTIDADSGVVEVDSGVGFQELFLKTAQQGLAGLEFAVGIPGTVGGALVSNAGAYRSNVSEFLSEIEIVHEGERGWVSPAWMEFSYRDSVLRRQNPPRAVLLRLRFKLPPGTPKAIYDEARDYQRQRISKQPPSASAGSFFKNVNDADLAQRLETLPPKLKEAGVVPAGYLIESVGLSGHRIGGAMLSRRHANFIVNVGGATATEIRDLAALARWKVSEAHGVTLEPEVLFLGRWD